MEESIHILFDQSEPKDDLRRMMTSVQAYTSLRTRPYNLFWTNITPQCRIRQRNPARIQGESTQSASLRNKPQSIMSTFLFIQFNQKQFSRTKQSPFNQCHHQGHEASCILTLQNRLYLIPPGGFKLTLLFTLYVLIMRFYLQQNLRPSRKHQLTQIG